MGALIVDLHMHSRYSDGQASVDELVDMYGQAGFDAIAITDHLCSNRHILGWSARLFGVTLTKDNWSAYQEALTKARARAWRQYRMHLIHGVEYTRNTFSHGRNAHMLALDIKDYISPDLPEEEWLTLAKQQGALTVAAHPLKLKDAASQTYYLWHRRQEFDGLIDVWECANARTMWPETFGKDLALVASSDLHSPKRWNSWRTSISCDNDVEALKAALKDRKQPREFVFVTGRVPEVQRLIHSQQEVSWAHPSFSS